MPPTSGSGASSWPDLLDALEERNRRQEEFLTAGGPPVPVPVLSDAGPLPPELALRAELLLVQTRRLEQLAESRLDAVRRALRYSRA